jgi:two-component system, chemotaxis family, chemotaxis protein CheY
VKGGVDQMDAAVTTMLVDDNAEIRTLMRMVITSAKLGLEVCCEVDSGYAALEALESCDPDVIVLDQMMPGLTGLETALRIRQGRPGQVMVFCSAYLDDHLRAEAQELGFAAVVPKEEITKLPQTILQAVGR